MIAWLAQGGPVVWPLLALSLVSATVTLERLLFWGRLRGRDDRLRAVAREQGVERLERRLTRGMLWLDTTVTVAPMLGILGTVLGIIQSFELLSGHGPPDPAAVSAGIAQALVSTAIGLVVAISALLPLNWMRGRVQAALAEVESDIAAEPAR